ncbi:MAG: 2-hydroxyacyl-CoA dehydratase family protein, partial [Planctomycetota bacterium]
MRELKQYPTRPIQLWGKMKELRRQHFRNIWQAHDQGRLITMGMSEAFLSLPAGFGDYAASSYGPYFTGIMRDRAGAIKVLEATEARGFGRDVCCAMRVHMGQVYMGLTTKSPLTGQPVVPDFIFQPNFCVNAGKAGRYLSEYLNIPILIIDLPNTDTPANRQYTFEELVDAIERMERITGRKFDDEKLIQATYNEWESMTLWSKVCLFTQRIPAPLDARHLMSLRQPVFTTRHETETVQFYRDLVAEMEERTRDGISARGFEGARLSFEPGVPFFYPNLYRYPEKYGAVTVICEESVDPMGAWEITPEGHWQVPLTPRERGLRFRTREDALGSLLDLY